MNVVPSDIVTFLLARITRDEEKARRLLVGAQRASLALQEPKLLGTTQVGWFLWSDVEAMAVRALADCEAKRQIVGLHDQSGLRWTGFPRADVQEAYCRHDQQTSPCSTLHYLAMPYQ